MLKRIAPDEVGIGMYIRRFEGSWFSHPFWRARFVVRNEDQLVRIRASGVHVFIDDEKGVAPAAPVRSIVADAPLRRQSLAADPQRQAPIAFGAPAVARTSRRMVAPLAFGKADKARAAALAERSTTVIKSLFETCQPGSALSTEPILSVVDDIAATLEQNSAAFINVTRLRSKDDAIYTHSVAVCALMIGLAREAGCPPNLIRAMGTAGLLHDVGKAVMDAALLNPGRELSAEEIAELRRHSEAGHAILADEAGLPPAALDVCLHHHERLDGSGYPKGLKGGDISHATRMAAICDTYDAMTSRGPQGKGLAPAEALAGLEEEAGRFDGGLLFSFMRSIGVFPPGKLIRLRTNRLAIILPSSAEDRLPLARAFYATVDSCFVNYQDVVLSERLSDDQAVNGEDPSRWFGADWPVIRARVEAGKPLTGLARAG